MFAAQIDQVLAEFTRRGIPFSHRDVAHQIPQLLPCHFDQVRQLVFGRMVRVPAYRLSIAHFVGEGLTLMCIPRETGWE
ncbi:MAG TPA: hypothetical protein VJG32_19820 [Anaerolineae bacterium]|nr:hypothetical protein [Anaerolineae bacterium]